MPRTAIPDLGRLSPELSGDRTDAITVADMLGMTVPSVHRGVREGLIPHWRIGRRVRFSRRAIEKFIADGGAASRPTDIAA